MSKPPSCTPTAVRPGMSPELYSHSPEDVRAGLMASLKAPKTDKLALWYLHGPDRGTQFEATLCEVDKLHKEGCFERFGISNYYSWEVARICDICEQNGWIKPTVYQGLYDTIRPVAKKHGLTESECGLRWLAHHSLLQKDKGDAIIVGASNTKHLEENLLALDKGPLPEEVVQALDDGWHRVRGKELNFWH